MESVNKLIRSRKAAWQQVEENIIVVTSRTRQMHILDGIGQRIWQLLENPLTVDEITGIIVAEYDAEPELIARDIKEFMKQLSEKSIVEAAGQ